MVRIERDTPGRAQPEPSLGARLAEAARRLGRRLQQPRGNAGSRPTP